MSLLLVAALTVAVGFLAALAQAVTGFGFALVAVPLLALLIGPVEAVVVATVTGLVLTTMSARRERAHVVRTAAARMTIGGFVGMPLGLLMLVSLDASQLRIVIAIVIVALVVLLWSKVPLPSGRRAQWCSGLVSGALLTSTGMNGPPIVLTLQSMRLPATAFRGTLQLVFWWQDLLAVLAFVAVGRVDLHLLLLAASGAVAIPAGWALGDRVFARVPSATFQLLILVALLVAAAASVAATLGG